MNKFIFILLCTLTLFLGCTPAPKLTPLKPNDVILAFGDSLTFGTGASPENSYPTILQNLLHQPVINAGERGDRATVSQPRLLAAMGKYHPRLVLLCLGGNDLLQRQSDEKIKESLAGLIRIIQQQGAEVVLIAVPYPRITFPVPDFYEELGTEFKIPVERKLFAKLLADRDFKSDMVHLNALGYQSFAQGLEEFLRTNGAIR